MKLNDPDALAEKLVFGMKVTRKALNMLTGDLVSHAAAAQQMADRAEVLEGLADLGAEIAAFIEALGNETNAAEYARRSADALESDLQSWRDSTN